MIYILLILVIALALVSGFEFAFIKYISADYRAEISALKYEKLVAERKAAELKQRLEKMGNIKEGLENV